MQAKSNNPKLTPIQTYLVARAFNESMKEFYKDPENQKKFEEWKSKKEAKENAVGERENRS